MAAKAKATRPCKVIDDDPEEPTKAPPPPSTLKEDDGQKQSEYDFVEEPSEDMFCPVTFELLLDPLQTMCCGHHLSLNTVTRLQKDQKPCPMCKKPKLSTMPDKFFGRKVKNILVRCPNKAEGCTWKGEVGGMEEHIATCPKRPWKCKYCEYSSTLDTEMEHVMNCTHYPTACPNQCDVGTIPRCEIKEHLKTCLLEIVACEFSDAGCNVKTTRMNLQQHMVEFQEQHLLSATVLNLKLTKETIAEKDRQLAEKDQQLAEKDKQITALQKQLKELQTSVAQVKVGVDHLLGGMKHCHEFTLSKVSQWKNWLSDPFFSHRGGYRLKLSMQKEKPSGYLFGAMTLSNMIVGLVLCKGEYDKYLEWPVTFFADVHLVDQLKDEKHFQQSYEYFFTKPTDKVKEKSSEHAYFVSRKALYPDGERSLYVVSDSIKIRLWLHLK